MGHPVSPSSPPSAGKAPRENLVFWHMHLGHPRQGELPRGRSRAGMGSTCQGPRGCLMRQKGKGSRVGQHQAWDRKAAAGTKPGAWVWESRVGGGAAGGSRAETKASVTHRACGHHQGGCCHVPHQPLEFSCLLPDGPFQALMMGPP